MGKWTNYIEQGPSLDAYSSSAGQVFEFLFHNNLPFVSILSQINPVKAFTGRFKKSFNLILPFTPSSSKWSLSLMFLHKNSIDISLLPHSCHISCPSYSPYPYNIYSEEQITKHVIMSPRRYPNFGVVAGLVWSYDPESYAGSSLCYW